MSVRNLARSPLVWLLIMALAIRLAPARGGSHGFRLHARFAFGDSDGYWTLAGVLLRGEPYEYGVPSCKSFARRAIHSFWRGCFWSMGTNHPSARRSP